MFETSPYPGRRHWCDLCHGHLGPGSPCGPDPEPEPNEENEDMNHTEDQQTQPACPMRWPADFPGKHEAPPAAAGEAAA